MKSRSNTSALALAVLAVVLLATRVHCQAATGAGAQTAAYGAALEDLGVLTADKASDAAAAADGATSIDGVNEAVQEMLETLKALTAQPGVQAAQGAEDFRLLSNAFYPVGSGDNLLETRKRIKALKAYYKEARTYLGADDAVRIGGYITRLENLGIDFIAAYPLGELSYTLTLIGVAASTLDMVGTSLSFVSSSISLVGSFLSVRSALNSVKSAFANVDPSTLPLQAAQALRQSPSVSLESMGIDGSITNSGLSQELIAAAADLNQNAMPWMDAQGLVAPLDLSARILQTTKESLTRLRTAVPASLLVDGPGSGGSLSMGVSG
ncbi:hypothetical protein FOA52_010436 [Chlamydomonas sp. UWO 241]|nr:hypothetical protein FOA52_010436 [Chlamydomonas sp. UWO 241]